MSSSPPVVYEPIEPQDQETGIIIKSINGVAVAEHAPGYLPEAEETAGVLSSTWFAVFYGGFVGSIAGAFLLNPFVGAAFGAVAAGVGTKAADLCVSK